MKYILNFNEISTHRELKKQFANKTVFVEILQHDTKNLQNYYLNLMYQLADYLSSLDTFKYFVSDAILINESRLFCNSKAFTNDKKELVIVFERKHYLFLNENELQNLIHETIRYWSPFFQFKHY